MKRIFVLVILSVSILYAQTDTTITSLRGMEDQNGITHLIYQIHYRRLGTDLDFVRSDYYILNTETKETKLLFNDYSNIKDVENPLTEIFSEHVRDFSFFGNDPNKFIYANNVMFTDPGCGIVRYDQGLVYSNTTQIQALQISVDDSNKVFAVHDNTLIQSHDGGYTWPDWSDTTRTQLNFQFLSFFPYNDSVMFGINNEQHLVKSTDAGNSFYQVSDDYWYSNTKFFFDLDEVHIYALLDGKFFSSNYKGENNSWNYVEIRDGHLRITPSNIALDESIPGRIYLSSERNLYVSNDFGNSFQNVCEFQNAITGLYKKPGVDSIYLSFANRMEKYNFEKADTLKIFDIDNALSLYPLKTGNKWYYHYSGILYNAPYPTPGDSYSGYETITCNGDTTLANGKKYSIVDTWGFYQETELQRLDSLRGIVFDKNRYFDEETTLYDLLATSGDYYEIPMIGEFRDVITSDTLLWGKKRLVKNYYYGSLDIMNQIFVQGIGLIYQHDEFDFGFTDHVLIGCLIDGVLYGDTTTVAIEPDTHELPNEFQLYQNYPNPFNPTTTISYFIPNETKVQLVVYDILGNKIAELVNEIKSAGQHKVIFDGSGLSSGIYFYRLKTNSQVLCKKLILLK